MNAIVTTGIVLSRTDYQEADRILTILTPDHGKIRVIAKGVRWVKSKLAGGIELFSVSHISYIPGKKDLGTLISTRLQQHFRHIATNLDRTMLGYDLLKLINRITEDNPEPEYFELLKTVLGSLDAAVPQDLLKLWLYMKLLKLTGHQPNLNTDTTGQKLAAHQTYSFSFEDMAFTPVASGSFTSQEIKLLRLALSTDSPAQLQKVQGIEPALSPSLQLAQSLLSQYVKLT